MAALQLLTQDKEGWKLLNGPPAKKGELVGPIPGPGQAFMHSSPSGRHVCAPTADDSGLQILDVSTQKVVHTLPCKGVKVAAWSPKGSFVVTWRPPAAAGDSDKNLEIWDVASAAVVHCAFVKRLDKDLWPYILWAPDEGLVGQLVANTLLLTRRADFGSGKASAQLRLPKIQVAALAATPGGEYFIGACVPEVKGQPGTVQLFSLDTLDTPVARKSFFNATDCTLTWNATATTLLAFTECSTDTTNRNYMGTSALHYLTTAGDSGSVPTDKEGPVHDYAWSPTGSEFLTVYGSMPAKATLFDAKVKVLKSFHEGPLNTVKWDPHGRFFCLGGFGNLPGDIEFWTRGDPQAKTPTVQQVGLTRASNTTFIEYSPDGRWLLTATTSPRLRIDNGFRLYTYYGKEGPSKTYETLYQATWMPGTAGAFPDRPVSPGRKFATAGAGAASSARIAGQGGKLEPHDFAAGARPKPAPFRPRHMQGGIPGAAEEEPAKPAGGAKKKRSRGKGAGGGGAGAGAGGEAEAEAAPEPAPATAAAPAAPEGGAEDKDKKIRNLQKKLRQIEDLKQKKASGAQLEQTQLQKIDGMQAIVDEIAALCKI